MKSLELVSICIIITHKRSLQGVGEEQYKALKEIVRVIRISRCMIRGRDTCIQ